MLRGKGLKPARPTRRVAPAFSLVELLVVIAILGLLLGMVYKGGTALIASSKARDTQGLIQTLEQAVQAYRSEVDQKRIPNAEAVFNGAPPDDLAVFLATGSNLSGCTIRMATGGSRILNMASLADPRDGSGRLAGPNDRRFGDVRALALAIRLRSPKAAAILDRIDSRFKKIEETNNPPAYDPGDGSVTIPLVYFVDAWGTPIEYYSTTKCPAGKGPRVDTSTALVRANNGDPVFVSYGPNGPDQFSSDMFASEGDTSIVADYASVRDPLTIDHPLNQDNIYSSEAVADKMSE